MGTERSSFCMNFLDPGQPSVLGICGTPTLSDFKLVNLGYGNSTFLLPHSPPQSRSLRASTLMNSPSNEALSAIHANVCPLDGTPSAAPAWALLTEVKVQLTNASGLNTGGGDCKMPWGSPFSATGSVAATCLAGQGFPSPELVVRWAVLP